MSAQGQGQAQSQSMAQAGGRKRKAGSDVPVRQLEVRDSMLVRAETSYNLPFDAVGGFAKNHTHVVFREALNNAGDFGITAANLKTTKLIVYYEEGAPDLPTFPGFQGFDLPGAARGVLSQASFEHTEYPAFTKALFAITGMDGPCGQAVLCDSCVESAVVRRGTATSSTSKYSSEHTNFDSHAVRCWRASAPSPSSTRSSPSATWPAR